MSSVTPLECEFKDKDLRAFELEPGDTLLFDFRTLARYDGSTNQTPSAERSRHAGSVMTWSTLSAQEKTSPPLKDLGCEARYAYA